MKPKLKFDIITIFPQIFDSYFSESIISRAQKNKRVEINVHNLRDYTTDKHKTVDDTPYGGGPGMVMKVEPIHEAINEIISRSGKIPNSKFQIPNKFQNSKSKTSKTRIILFSAKGKKYTQRDVERLKKYENLILICGRYEGVDERVAEHIADEEISIGDYVLTGGEIPAMILVDSITRLLPGVLGNSESLKEESFNSEIKNSKLKIQNSGLEYPQYTKPEVFNGWKAPAVLLSGHHQKIAEWRKKKTKRVKK
jgi:tRNA (guanine37-N1)-methyltransferase